MVAACSLNSYGEILFYFIPFHFTYVIYADSVVRNGWARASVWQTGRPDHLSFV